MGKLKPSWRNILRALQGANGDLVAQSNLPDGNGREGCARGEVLRAMQAAGLIQLDRESVPQKMLSLVYQYGYRITDAGRRALAEHEGEG